MIQQWKKGIQSIISVVTDRLGGLLPTVRGIRLGSLIRNLGKVSVIILATLGSIFTIFTGVLAFQNVDSFREWFNKEFETEQYWLSAANSLSPEVNISFFDKRLGEPAYISVYNGLANRTYVNDYFFTQALVADDGSVLLFSITLRKDDFYPEIPYLVADEGRPRLLGKTTYGDMVANGPASAYVASQYIPGFRRGLYSEAYYYGNPGNYLYYFLSSNDAGGMDTRYADLEKEAGGAFTFEDTGLYDDCSRDTMASPGNLLGKTGPAMEEAAKARALMANAVANTVTVTGRSGLVLCNYQDFFKKQRKFILGPDLDKVRLLRDEF